MSSPPTILIAIASGLIRWQWASTTGNAASSHISISSLKAFFHISSFIQSSPVNPPERIYIALTNTHNDQKAGQKPAQLHDAVSACPAIHEIIGVGGFAAYPVRQRRDTVGGYYEQREVVLEEGGGEDDEEEAYG